MNLKLWELHGNAGSNGTKPKMEFQISAGKIDYRLFDKQCWGNWVTTGKKIKFKPK